MPVDRLIVQVGRKIGRRHAELAKSWLSSGVLYGAAAFATLVYFTDWRVIATKIPIYNTKFKD